MRTKITPQSKIAFLGLGLENQALLFFLLKKYQAKNLNITICDARSQTEILSVCPQLKKTKKLKWKTGSNFNVGLENFSILFRSPGWPILCPGIQSALKNKVVLSSPMNYFFEICPSKNIIAVSGTKGKGTTASLISQIIKDSGKKCFLAGNIGIAPMTFVDKIKKSDWIVLELSSFQLEDLKFKAKISVFTNIFKEHLSPADPKNPNFHRSFKEYFQAKMNLSLLQDKNDYLVANYKLKNKISHYRVASKIIYFKKSKANTRLVGDFNLENVAAAEEVAKILKVNKNIYLKTIADFSNLNHRLEFVKKINNVSYFDNSFSTTPESTVLDLKSFKNNIILIAGGADKGANFLPLAKEIKKRVKFLLLLAGKGTERIKIELKKVNYSPKKMIEVFSMPEAVNMAKKQAQNGDTVLLSTGCASFGLFKNYKERGNLFQEEVKK